MPTIRAGGTKPCKSRVLFFLSFLCSSNQLTLSLASSDFPSAAEEAYFEHLRGLAHAAHSNRVSYDELSQEAVASGRLERAKKLSNKAEMQKHLRDDYNLQASNYIFAGLNRTCTEHEIDLHRLYVKEAFGVLEKKIKADTDRGNSEIHV